MGRERPIVQGLRGGWLVVACIGLAGPGCRAVDGEVFSSVPDALAPTNAVAAGSASAAGRGPGVDLGAPSNAGASGEANAGRAAAGRGPMPGMAGTTGAGTGLSEAGRVSSVSPTQPPLDPNVRFEWAETAPNGGPCGPGKFIGSFSCEISAPLLVLLYTHVEGSVQIGFSGSAEAPQLDITMGELNARDNTGQEFLKAPITGALNCGTRVVTAELPSTATNVLPLDRQLFWLLPDEQPTTTGWLRGNLDPEGRVVNGDLAMTFNAQTYCIGTFAVTAAP
jgi:hypothetical protein